jgi:hypothetical protein
MAYTFSFIEGENLVLVTGSGRVTGDEIVQSATLMFENARWAPAIDQICDFRNVDGLLITYAHIKAILALEKKYDDRIGPGHQALVVKNDLQHSICLLYKTMAQLAGRPQIISIFRSIDQALQWLGKEELAGILTAEEG